jgi:hypothetical protein
MLLLLRTLPLWLQLPSPQAGHPARLQLQQLPPRLRM